MPRKPLKFGRNTERTRSRECDECGVPMRANSDGISVCSDCSRAAKRRLRMADKSEVLDRDVEDDEERADFRDAYLGMLEQD